MDQIRRIALTCAAAFVVATLAACQPKAQETVTAQSAGEAPRAEVNSPTQPAGDEASGETREIVVSSDNEPWTPVVCSIDESGGWTADGSMAPYEIDITAGDDSPGAVYFDDMWIDMVADEVGDGEPGIYFGCPGNRKETSEGIGYVVTTGMGTRIAVEAYPYAAEDVQGEMERRLRFDDLEVVAGDGSGHTVTATTEVGYADVAIEMGVEGDGWQIESPDYGAVYKMEYDGAVIVKLEAEQDWRETDEETARGMLGYGNVYEKNASVLVDPVEGTYFGHEGLMEAAGARDADDPTQTNAGWARYVVRAGDYSCVTLVVRHGYEWLADRGITLREVA